MSRTSCSPACSTRRTGGATRRSCCSRDAVRRSARERLAAMQRVTLRLALSVGLDETVLRRGPVRRRGRRCCRRRRLAASATTRRRRSCAGGPRRRTSSGPPTARRPWPGPPGRVGDAARAAGSRAASSPAVLPWDEARRERPGVTDVLAPGDTEPDRAVAPRAVVLASLHDGQRRIGLLACRLDGADGLGAEAAAALHHDRAAGRGRPGARQAVRAAPRDGRDAPAQPAARPRCPGRRTSPSPGSTSRGRPGPRRAATSTTPTRSTAPGSPS